MNWRKSLRVMADQKSNSPSKFAQDKICSDSNNNLASNTSTKELLDLVRDSCTITLLNKGNRNPTKPSQESASDLQYETFSRGTGDECSFVRRTILKLRSPASQSCAIFPYNCLHFVLGTVTGFHIILIAELHKTDSEIPTSLEQLSWFASLDIIKLAGTMITGLLMHHLGCRLVALTMALLFVSSLLLYHFSTTATIIIFSRVIGSLLAVNPLSGPYISEISESHLRSSFLAMVHLSCSLGTFFSLLLGSLLYWRTVILVNLAFPILATVTVLATPNSPTWLASKGRFGEAEKALCWTRGWVGAQYIQAEYRALVDDGSSNSNNNEPDTCSERSRQFLRLFLRRSFYLPFGTFALMLVLSNLSGVSATESYATIVFRMLNSPIEESVATAIMGAMSIVGNLVILLFIRRAGKRKLIFISVSVIGLCQATIAIIGFLELRDEYLWVPPIAVIIASFANASGIGAIMFMLIPEIFPSSVRYIATSMSIAVKVIGSSLMNKVFLYFVEAVTLSGVFFFFALMNLVGLIIYYFLFPETEGRTLQEIEDHFKGVRSAEEAKT